MHAGLIRAQCIDVNVNLGRIAGVIICVFIRILHFNPENTALAHGAVQANAATHQLHQLLRHHQTNASAGLGAALLPQPIEGLKQLGDLGGGQARTGVFDTDSQMPGVVGIEGEAHAAALPVVFDGVGQQIDQRLLEPGSVSMHIDHCRRFFKIKVDAAPIRIHFNDRFALHQQRRNRHALHHQLKLARLDHRQVQNLIDQLQQVPAGL